MTDGMSHLAVALADRYRIERELGAGGMATVYLAADLKHDRQVAIKVLKPELAAVLGAERFVQEIKTTAALSHPHILPLFDSGEAGGFLYYVMPYIRGETIREKLTRETQFGVEEAVRIATEVADALDYAHRQGVIHRDIKPENILLHDGRPMVMDFGIALAVSAAAGGRMTETGLSLGTPHYMSPEQATADKQITARSDVYSLASVLYEMLTGEPPHTGSSAQAIIMKIVTDTPRPATELRKSVPAHVAAALVQALEKLPADRFESARAFAGALANPAFRVVGSEAGVTSTPRGGRSVPLPIVGAMATVLVALASWGWTRSAPRMLRDVVRFQTTIPAESSEPLTGPRFALSPDGRTLVYRAADDADQPTAFVRRLDQLESARLTGATAFAVSPDGSTIAFTTAGNELRTMPSAGGSARTIAGQVSPNDALEWGEDGYVYHVQDSQAGGVWRVPAEGGTPEQVVARDSIGATAGFSQPREPSVLPGARGLVVTFYRGVVLPSDVAVADLSTREVKYLFKGSHATYIDGFIVFVGENAQLMAVPFDAERLSVTGAPRALGITVANLGESTWAYALSKSGTLVYATQAGGRSLLTWVSREGTGDVVDPELQRSFTGISIDPAGRRLAIAVDQSGQQAIWQYDLRERTMSRVTFDGVEVSRPLWSADGRRIAYLSDRGSDAGLRSIWSSAADGTGEPTLVVASLRHAQEITWSADGRSVAHREGYTDGLTNRDIMVLRAGADTTRRPFLATNADEQNPKLSPDGRWLAYVSDFSGRREVYVQPFPSGSGRWQISSAGGTQPLWRRDGREIYYLSLDGQFVAVPVLTSTGFAHGAPVALFSTSRFLRDVNATTYDITPDGARFLFIQRSDEDDIVVVVNWLDELKRQFGMAR